MPTLTLSFAPHTRTADAAVRAPRKNLRVFGSDTVKLLFRANCIRKPVQRRRGPVSSQIISTLFVFVGRPILAAACLRAGFSRAGQSRLESGPSQIGRPTRRLSGDWLLVTIEGNSRTTTLLRRLKIDRDNGESSHMSTLHFWEPLTQDIKYALRGMAGSKLFTGMAVLSLALGIGANTAIYSFMDSVMLRALPVQHSEQLVVLNWRAKSDAPVVHSHWGDNYNEPGGGPTSPNFRYPA